MPSSPELGNALRDEWIIKVLQELKPEHSSETDCHFGIAAEIEIELEAVCNNSNP